MYKKIIVSKLFLFAAAFSLTILLAFCSKDENPIDSNQQYSQIDGRLTGGSGFNKLLKNSSAEGIEGATVTVYKVEADGSLNSVSNGTVQTDAQGNFSIQTTANAESNLLVECVKGSSKWQAIVSGEVKYGQTTHCPPINDETTEEAKTYSRVKSEGKSSTVTYSDIRMIINAQLAQQIKADESIRAQVISALETAANARLSYLLSSDVSASSSQLQAVVNADAQAQVNYDNDLYVSNDSQASAEVAYSNYCNTMISAYTNTGLKVESAAKAIQIAAKAFVKAMVSANSQTKSACEQSSAKISAYFIAKALEENFKAMGATQAQINAVITAGAALKSTIVTSTTESERANAFVKYHDDVLVQLKAAMNSYAQAITTADSAINSAAGAKAILISSLNVAASPALIVQAYLTFFGAVQTVVQTALSNATQAQVNSATQALILANIY
ncbi:hypothetical protein ABRY23_04835 [Melioribacteraceae bacterium 4301-Me]|uniref:hypothetical protein n=1 Tax=Pyranulibacter aquaticus TaxID=3163344 RepID=UPI00359B7FDC